MAYNEEFSYVTDWVNPRDFGTLYARVIEQAETYRRFMGDMGISINGVSVEMDCIDSDGGPELRSYIDKWLVTFSGSRYRGVVVELKNHLDSTAYALVDGATDEVLFYAEDADDLDAKYVEWLPTSGYTEDRIKDLYGADRPYDTYTKVKETIDAAR